MLCAHFSPHRLSCCSIRNSVRRAVVAGMRYYALLRPGREVQFRSFLEVYGAMHLPLLSPTGMSEMLVISPKSV